MRRKPEDQVCRWLHHLKIPVSAGYIKEQIRSNPAYPSLVCITDTLDALGIEYAALETDKEKMEIIPAPYLMHTHLRGGEFILVEKLPVYANVKPGEYEARTGIIVVAAKSTILRDKNHQEKLDSEKNSRYAVALTILLALAFPAISLYYQFSWSMMGLMFSALAGILIAIMIVRHESGYDTALTEQLCDAGKNTDCDAVINSEGSTLFKGFRWADAGIIYFITEFILLQLALVTGLAGSICSIIAIGSIGAIPFTIYSVYYQGFIVKKWCPLCLLTVGLLWLQAAILTPSLLQIVPGYSAILLSLFVLAIVATGWFLIVHPLLRQKTKFESNYFLLWRFKNNPTIFSILLEQQRHVDITPFENELQLGNADAPVQIMVACGPYCGPCAVMHELLDELLDKHDIGLSLRFAVSTANSNDTRLIAADYLLQLLKQETPGQKRRILHEWYAIMNLDKFRLNYPLKKETDVSGLLKQHERWSEKSKITHTPTIFINGYELPKHYHVSELRYFIQEQELKKQQMQDTRTGHALAFA